MPMSHGCEVAPKPFKICPVLGLADSGFESFPEHFVKHNVGSIACDVLQAVDPKPETRLR